MAVVRKVHSGRSPESLKPKVKRQTEPDVKLDDEPTTVGSTVCEVQSSQIEYEMSPTIDKLAKAFVAFRAVCPNMDKDKDGYNYRYTTLGSIIATSREHLEANGLAVMQFPIAGLKSLGVITILMHESGQFIRARFLMPIPSLSGTNVTQDEGAAITYARRYALSAVLCVASDEDTDGVAKARRK